jgi:hypothetical protein
MHADKHMARAKRRNWLAIQSHIRKHTAETKMEDEKGTPSDGKSSHCLWQSELKNNNVSFEGLDILYC